MTPIIAEKEPPREVQKRYPAPSCPECKSPKTIVTNTYPDLRRFFCLNCGNRWKNERML